MCINEPSALTALALLDARPNMSMFYISQKDRIAYNQASEARLIYNKPPQKKKPPFYKSAGEIPRQMGQGIISSVMKRCHWVEPALVAQIKFTEWTSDDQLRQPVFLRLRTDQQEKDVVRE